MNCRFGETDQARRRTDTRDEQKPSRRPFISAAYPVRTTPMSQLPFGAEQSQGNKAGDEPRSSDNHNMSTAAPQRRTYDPNIRRLVAEGRGDDIVRQLNIPRFAVSGWKRRPLPPIVSVGTCNETTEELQARICKLEQRVSQEIKEHLLRQRNTFDPVALLQQ